MELFFISFFGWVLCSALNYVLVMYLYHDTHFLEWVKSLKVRMINILMRVYVVLGPITFVLTFTLIFLYMIYLFAANLFVWLINVDNENVE